jgi:ABC-type antimicrobial peptide transport system permease subunit
VAVAIGVPLGLGFVRIVGDQQTAAQGFSSGVVQVPGAGAVALLLAGGVTCAALGALPCAWLAARTRVADVLRSE